MLGQRRYTPGVSFAILPKTFAIEQAYYLQTPPSHVFEGLTSPTMLVKWFLSKARVEPTSGGDYTFDWIGGYHMTGTVHSFEQDRAVAYTWHDKIDGGELVETLASFELTRKGDGTLLRLRHTGFTDPEHFAECSSRWGYYLTNLKSVLDHGIDLRSRYDG